MKKIIRTVCILGLSCMLVFGLTGCASWSRFWTDMKSDIGGGLNRKDKMRVFFLHGVLDTSIKTKGIEYVIDTDGHCYCDYYRRTKIEDYQYEVGKIYDAVSD